MTNWQKVRYGDTDEARAALAYYLERGWPTDDPGVFDPVQEALIDGFQVGYRAGRAAERERCAKLVEDELLHLSGFSAAQQFIVVLAAKIRGGE